MDFMIVPCIVLLISVLLTYKLSNYLGLPLQRRPLFLCAFCALAINLILPSIPPAVSRYHLLLLFSVILCIAFFIAQYNEKLAVSAETGRSVALPPPMQTKPQVIKMRSGGSPRSSVQAKPLRKLTKTLRRKKRAASESPASKIQAPTNDTLIASHAILEKLTSLDAILDYAEDQKQARSYTHSILAFKQALARYENDAYAPFIAIELGNLHKGLGQYDEAIAAHQKALALSCVSGSSELQKEFKNNISYLRIVKFTLLKHNCVKLPFSKIPEPVMQEIESRFTRWRSQKYAS